MLDYNGLIHPASAKYLKTLEKTPKDLEKGILQEVWKTTQELVGMVQPSSSVQIYVDGVAPIAKMNQQRRRRFLSIHRKKLTQETSLWDSNAISPGTTFMTRLTASIRAYIRCRKDKDTQYHFSSADEAGEGEHKLFERLCRLYQDPNETKVIYGMDADLIMLSLMSHISNIYLLRENPRTPEEYMYLDIDALRQGILKDLYHNYEFEIDEEAFRNPFSKQAREVIESYIVMCFLLGNDFLPHSVGLQLKKGGLEELLLEASKLWNSMKIPVVDIDTETIQWNFISQLLDILSKNENDKFFDEVSGYYHRKPRYETKEEEIDCYPLCFKDPLVHQLLFKIDRQKWRLYYYKSLFHCPMNDTSVIMSACDLYLQGILWTYQYYKRRPYNPMWYYPYAYSPTIRDISNYLNGHLPAYEKLPETWKKEHPHPRFVEPIVQLLTILPKESVHCLPLKYHPLMENHPKLSYMYPTQYRLHTFMKNKLWECIPILPPMNIPMVESVVKDNNNLP